MSKLKEWTASEIEEYDDARLELAEDCQIDCTRVYIKEDVDKEIAELKERYKDMDVTHTVHIAKMNAKIAQLEDDVAFWKAKTKGEMV